MRYKIEVHLGNFHIIDTDKDKSIYFSETPENIQKIVDIMNFEAENPYKKYGEEV